MITIRQRTQDERGSVTVFTTLAMCAMVLAFVLMVCLVCMFVQKSGLDNDLEVAREETLANGFQMELKNANDPGALIANRVYDSLRRNGYDGAFTMQFYEATDAQIRAANPGMTDDEIDQVRCMAYQVVLEQGTYEVIPGASLLNGVSSDLTVSSGIACAMCPYSLYKTYKPGDMAGVAYNSGVLYVYKVSADGQVSSSTAATSTMTTGMSAAVEAAKAKPVSVLAGN